MTKILLTRRQALKTVASATLLSGCASLSKRGATNLRFSGETEFDSATLAELKQKTAVFVLRRQDEAQADQYRQALSKAWTYSPLEVVTWDEAQARANSTQYVFFIIEYLTKTIDRYKGSDSSNMRAALVLISTLHNGDEVEGYCRIPLSILGHTFSAGESRPAQTGEFRNWSPAMLSLYLKDVSLELADGRRRWFFQSMPRDPALAVLKQNTLYVPRHALTQYSRGSASGAINIEELLKEYSYPHQRVDPDELLKVVSEKPDALVLDSVQDYSDKFVSVYSMNAGAIYRRYVANSFGITTKDIAALKVAIG